MEVLGFRLNLDGCGLFFNLILDSVSANQTGRVNWELGDWWLFTKSKRAGNSN